MTANQLDGGNAGSESDRTNAIHAFVFRYCRARVGRVGRSFAVADDLARDVSLAVLAALPRGGDGGRPVLAFVYAIASSRVDQATGGKTWAGGGPELRRLLATLPETQREVVLLRMILGLSAEETAEAVGMSSSAVRLTQHRALQRLRGSLGAE